MAKKLISTKNSLEEVLVKDLSSLIEKSKLQISYQANSALTLLFWNVGATINEAILQNKRAAYGKQIIQNIAATLELKYGRNFTEKNVRRMIQFAEQFNDFEIVVPLARQLSWSHFLILLPLKDNKTKLYYAKKAMEENLGKRELRNSINNKDFERTAIANLQLSSNSKIPFNTFKDPYLLEFLDLQPDFLEKDLENAILKELEKFILELGKGFAFIERQKRMILDGDDLYLDLLFYHRNLKRLVAIELKLGKFEAKHKGQMELYLKYLDKYEKADDELPPIGLILCAQSSREQVELLEMHKDGIMVAEYWTDFPSKKEIQQKLHLLYVEAKEKIERNKMLQNEK